MKFTISNHSKIQQFIEIFKVIKNLSSHCSLFCNEERVYIQIMDGSHISLLDVKVQKDWFDTYDSSIENISFGSNLFVKILGLYTQGSQICFQTTSDGDKLSIDLSFSDGSEKSFEIPLMDIDSDILDPGENEYSMECLMNTKVFDKYISELMLFGEVLDIKCKNDNIFFKTCASDTKYSIKIPQENMEEFLIEEDLTLSTKVDIKYINYITKFFSVFKNIRIYVDPQFPLKFYYDESYSTNTYTKDLVSKDNNDRDNVDGEEVDEDEDDESKTKLLSITFYVAPKIDDDNNEDNDDDEEDDDFGENEIIG